jgi:pimeloyl-ACP methyl ester carboxylesterase
VAGDGGGTPLLLSHGFSATGRMFAPTVAALQAGRRCVTWDLRGHGRSDSPADPSQYSPELVLGDMAAILDAAEIGRAVLLGHSLGGFLSLDFARAHPERVAGLVLVGTGPGYRRDDAREGWNEMCERFARALEERGFDGLPGRSEEVEASAHRSVDGLVLAARHILTQRDGRVLEHLPAIAVPTVVIVGSDDKQFLAGSEYMASKVPGARRALIEGAGHAPMLSHPDRFLAVVGSFLDEVDQVT